MFTPIHVTYLLRPVRSQPLENLSSTSTCSSSLQLYCIAISSFTIDKVCWQTRCTVCRLVDGNKHSKAEAISRFVVFWVASLVSVFHNEHSYNIIRYTGRVEQSPILPDIASALYRPTREERERASLLYARSTSTHPLGQPVAVLLTPVFQRCARSTSIGPTILVFQPRLVRGYRVAIIITTPIAVGAVALNSAVRVYGHKTQYCRPKRAIYYLSTFAITHVLRFITRFGFGSFGSGNHE